MKEWLKNRNPILTKVYLYLVECGNDLSFPDSPDGGSLLIGNGEWERAMKITGLGDHQWYVCYINHANGKIKVECSRPLPARNVVREEIKDDYVIEVKNIIDELFYEALGINKPTAKEFGNNSRILDI